MVREIFGRLPGFKTTNSRYNNPFLQSSNSTALPSTRLFPVVAPHPQDLHHSYEDVEKVQLQTDTLVYRIFPDQTSFR